MKEKLTQRQEAFCQEISKGASQYKAYITAYPKAKEWKREAVDTQASQLMSNSKVVVRLEELRKPKLDETERIRKLITDTCENIINTDIGDFYEKKINPDGTITIDIVDLDKVDTRAIQEISFVGRSERVKIKLESKSQAMKTLEDIHGLHEVKVDNNVSISMESDFDEMAD